MYVLPFLFFLVNEFRLFGICNNMISYSFRNSQFFSQPWRCLFFQSKIHLTLSALPCSSGNIDLLLWLHKFLRGSSLQAFLYSNVFFLLGIHSPNIFKLAISSSLFQTQLVHLKCSGLCASHWHHKILIYVFPGLITVPETT